MGKLKADQCLTVHYGLASIALLILFLTFFATVYIETFALNAGMVNYTYFKLFFLIKIGF